MSEESVCPQSEVIEGFFPRAPFIFLALATDEAILLFEHDLGAVHPKRDAPFQFLLK